MQELEILESSPLIKLVTSSRRVVEIRKNSSSLWFKFKMLSSREEDEPPTPLDELILVSTGWTRAGGIFFLFIFRRWHVILVNVSVSKRNKLHLFQ